MNDSMKTILFVAIAGLSITVAAVAHFASQPQPVEGYALVGEEFFPEFQDPNAAESLRVLAFNADIAQIKKFEIEHRKTDGLWVIPPYDYPADAKDRLSKTAASIIGIQRGALISRREADHEKYKVIDPLDENSADLKNRGQRITLTQDDETVLADYIIGKEHASRPGYYYVRNPKEKETYLAKFSVDISTKFSDWIQSDLLQITGSDIRGITIKRYTIDERIGEIKQSETNILSRKSSTDPWQLEGLKEAEEVAEDTVSSLISQLGGLQIVGVRPKPAGINSDLTINQKVVQNQITLDLLVRELQSKGFYIVPDKQTQRKLVSNEGEVIAATDGGIVYDLYFGDLFTGSEFDIDVDFSADKSEKSDEKPKDKKQEAKGADEKTTEPPEAPAEENTDDDDKPKTYKSRYLFVAAKFDPKFLGDIPVKPTGPVKQQPKPPEKPKPKENKKPTPDDKKKTEKPKTEKPKVNKPADKKPVEKKPADKKEKQEETSLLDESAESKSSAPKEEPVKDKPTKDKPTDKPKDESKDKQPEEKPKEKKETPEETAYKLALDKYKSDLLKYEADKTAYDEKVRKGLEEVEKLNKRLGQWYYVISADSFENLRLARKELVKPKEEKKEGAAKPPANPFQPPGGLLPPKK